jgi:hypothetical protein
MAEKKKMSLYRTNVGPAVVKRWELIVEQRAEGKAKRYQ